MDNLSLLYVELEFINLFKSLIANCNQARVSFLSISSHFVKKKKFFSLFLGGELGLVNLYYCIFDMTVRESAVAKITLK